MNINPRRDEARCRWSRPRLSLLAGGELVGDERRNVEQHLITCPACQAELASRRSVLDMLRDVRQFEDDRGPETIETPASIWPALRQRMDEEKHAPRRPILAELGPWFDALVLAIKPRRPVLAAGLVLVLAAFAVGRWADRRVDEAQRQWLQAQRPLPTSATPRWLPLPPPTAGTELAEAIPSPARAEASRIDYDLDHGTPMNPDTPESGTGAY